MSIEMEDDIKRWTARRKSALVLEIIQGRADRGLGASDRMVPPPDARPEERTLHRRAQPRPVESQDAKIDAKEELHKFPNLGTV